MANDLLSTSKGGVIEDNELSKEDMVDFLNQDDDTNKEKEEKEEKDEEVEGEVVEEEGEKEKKGKEKSEDEIELKDEDEDEEVKLVTPFKTKELLKKYPNILKEFPYLGRAYYRDQQFSETFATPVEAKEAAERIQVLDSYEQALSQGNTESILRSVKENDEKAFNKLVDNYLPTLAKIDSEAHLHIVGGIVKNLIVSMVRESKSTDNEELKKVALAINQYAFGSNEFVPHTPLVKSNEQEDEVKKEREQFIQERFETARDDLDTKVNNVLRATIIEHIDPKEMMTDYVKKTAIRNVQEEVTSLLEKDSTFRKQLDSLWKKSFDSKFSKESLNAIRSAYLSKAKTVLPQIIKHARNEALRGLGKRVKDDDTEIEEKSQSSVRRSSTTSTNRSGQKQGEIPRGMTTLEFLNKD